MADVVKFLRALAAGLSAFGAVNRGESEFQVIVDQKAGPDEDMGVWITADNPWLSDDQALTMRRVTRGMLDTYSGIAASSPSAVFTQSRDVGVATLCLVATSEQSRETVDKGWLYEIARVANRLFATDTEPDKMFAYPAQLTYFRTKDLSIDYPLEVQAFFDASFSGDLERAVKVSNVVAARGVEMFKAPEDPREAIESQMRRVFAAMLLLEMSGTLAAQITPDLVPDLADRPIGGAIQADPFAMPDEDGDASV